MKDYEELQGIVKSCRSNIFDILEAGGIGHSGGSLSVLEILVALYYEIAKNNPEDPKWEERDRIVLSKAHACEAMYAVLGEKGFFPKEQFKEFLKYDSMLQGHTEICTPGVEYSGGSLGQGISFACGLAYSAKLNKKDHKVFCIVHKKHVLHQILYKNRYNYSLLEIDFLFLLKLGNLAPPKLQEYLYSNLLCIL